MNHDFLRSTLINHDRNVRILQIHLTFFLLQMIKQYRIFSLDFPRIDKATPHLRVKTGNREFSSENRPEKIQMGLWVNGKSKQNLVNFKLLQFRGQENDRNRSYSGSLAVNLACRASRMKNANCLSRMGGKSRELMSDSCERDDQGLSACTVGGKKLSLESTHIKTPRRKVSIPVFPNNPKRKLLKIDHPIHKNT